MLPLVLLQVLERLLQLGMLERESGLQLPVAADGVTAAAGGVQVGLVVEGQVVLGLGSAKEAKYRN